MPPSSTHRPGWLAVLFGATWILLWSSATLLFDGALAQSIARQLLALTFRPARGVVTSSRVIVESDAEGTSSKPVVEYTYTVDRSELFGNTIRHPSFEIGDGDARRIVDRFPTGSQITVYYDPQNPTDSLLLPGLCAGHAFMALFMMPFNMIMLGGWLGAWCWLFGGRPGGLPWGVTLRPTFDGFILRLYSTSPLAMAVGAVLGTSFAGIFLVAFGSLLLPPELLVALAWLAVFTLPAALARRQRRKAILLEVNELRGTFDIWDADNRRPTIGGPLKEVKTIAIRERTKRDSDGDVAKTYSVVFVLERGKQRLGHRCLVAGWNEQAARQLSGWLSQRLKLPAQSCLA